MQIIDGKELRNKILNEVKSEVAKLSFTPVFCDVLVGTDRASLQYVDMKAKRAESVGISFHGANFPVSISTEELIKEINVLNVVPYMCGIIIQLPLPEHIDKQRVLDAIDPRLDVDCLGKTASENFYNGDINIGYPAALSCIALLDSLNINLDQKKIVIIGQGMLVGKPVTALLNFRGLNPNIVRSKTENKEEIIKQADIIISAMGQGKFITGDMIKNGAIVIDAGTSESNGSIVGDVDFESVKDVASYVSPVPGGVGPMTVAILLKNVLRVAQSRTLTDGVRHDFE